MGQPGIWPLPLKKVSLPRFFFESFKFKFVLIAPEITNELCEIYVTHNEYFQETFYKNIVASEKTRGTSVSFCLGNVLPNAEAAPFEDKRGVTVCRLPLVTLSRFKEENLGHGACQYFILDFTFGFGSKLDRVVCTIKEVAETEMVRTVFAYGKAWRDQDPARVVLKKKAALELVGRPVVLKGIPVVEHTPYSTLGEVTAMIHSAGFIGATEKPTTHAFNHPMYYSEFSNPEIFGAGSPYQNLFCRCNEKTLKAFENTIDLCLSETLTLLKVTLTVEERENLQTKIETHFFQFLVFCNLIDAELVKSFRWAIRHTLAEKATKAAIEKMPDILITGCHKAIERHFSNFNSLMSKELDKSFYPRTFLNHKSRKECAASRLFFAVVFAHLYPTGYKKTVK
jgi:hypothetical protein